MWEINLLSTIFNVFHAIIRKALRLGHMSLRLITWQHFQCVISQHFSRWNLGSIKSEENRQNHQNIVTIYSRRLSSSVINLNYFVKYGDSFIWNFNLYAFQPKHFWHTSDMKVMIALYIFEVVFGGDFDREIQGMEQIELFHTAIPWCALGPL